MSLRLMKERIRQSGNSLYDEQVKDAQDALAYGFKDDVSCAEHIFFWIAGENPRKGRHLDIKFYDRKYSSANGNMQSFLTHNKDRIEVGDYIYDELENTYWICTEAFHVDNIHHEGKFTQCNWCLKWQRSDGTVLEYPCVDLNSTQYNSGESGNNIIRLGSAQHMETVQATEDTIALASPQRFYISRNYSIPYIVTQNDTTANNYGKGLCKVTVTQDLNHNSNDRPDLGICDYIEPASPLSCPPTPDEMTDLKAVISGEKEMSVGFASTYIVTFMDKNTGRDIQWEDVNFSWNIVSDFEHEIEQNVSRNGIELLIENENCADEKFRLQILVDKTILTEIVLSVKNIM